MEPVDPRDQRIAELEEQVKRLSAQLAIALLVACAAGF
jgi:hypothetical protein